MPLSLLLVLALGQKGQVESKDFSKDAQTAALRATVKIVNVTRGIQASAVIIKQEPITPYFRIAAPVAGVVVLGVEPKTVSFLTAAHVARVGDKLEIWTFTSEGKIADKYKSALVRAADEEKDIAVIELITIDSMPGVLPLCPPKKVADDKDFAGLTTGCGAQVPTCQVEAVRRKVKVQRPGEKDTTLVWELAEAPVKGRSGGPLVDRRGLVIGIASGANDGLGYYVHIDEIHRFLKRKGVDGLYEEERK